MGKFNPERLLNDDNNKKDTLTFENMRRLTAKTECHITCHAKCTHLVPDFCGMPMRTASEMIDQIQRA
ncbi:1746_t:CDS:2, partial [Entrophospora sp. SA101]